MSYRVLQPIFDGQTTYEIGQVVPDDTFSEVGAIALMDVNAIAPLPTPPVPAQAEPHTQTFHPEASETLAVEAEPVTASISLNQATEQELIDLPHIGTVTAGRILAQRPYDSLDDARQASGLSASKWAEILPLVTL